MDHYSLKFILDQQPSTIPQHMWVSKLFGYGFTVEYHPGKLNGATDTLSRHEVDAVVQSLSVTPQPLRAWRLLLLAALRS
jgi:hypothetical protein